jgi:pilus assembly protein Flp/PilA
LWPVPATFDSPPNHHFDYKLRLLGYSIPRRNNSSAHQTGEQQMKNLARLLKDESGVTAIEYGLIAAAMGLALVAAMPPIKAGLTTIFGEVSSSLSAK